MKPAIIILLFITIASHAFSQVDAQAKEYYLAKSNYQKKAAWIMLGNGAAITMLGVAITEANSTNHEFANSSTTNVAGTIVTIIGATAVFASIPIFIRAAHNKNAAISLSANLQNLQTLHTAGAVTIAQPSIKIKLNL